MQEPDHKTLLLRGDPFDPVTQLVMDSLLAQGRTVSLNDAADPGRHSAVLWCDQGRCLAGLMDPAEAGLPGAVILRRPGNAISAASWATGLAALSAIRRVLAPGALRLLALTESAASTFATAGVADVAVWSANAVFDPATRPDNRLLGRIDPEAGLIRTASGDLPLDAQNWAQIRQGLRLLTDALPQTDLRDIAELCNQRLPTPAAPRQPMMPVYVAVVTNGVGLGHLTRLLAIADALRVVGGARVVFWCFSQAAGLLAAAGCDVVQRMTANHLGCDYPNWIRWEAAALSALLAELAPAGLIVDSSGVDPFVVRALRQPGNGRVPLILIRRAMWQKHFDPAVLDAAQHCRLVIEPGDLSSAADRGPTVTAVPRFAGFARMLKTAPVLLKEGNALLPRAAARKALDLPRWWRRVVLVSLGGEAFGRDATLAADLVTAAKRAGVRLVWVQSPLARPPQALAAHRLTLRKVYPLGRFLGAFDGIITSCGYNSFHEAMLSSRSPVLLVPTQNERLDDQSARAMFAQEQGWARVLVPDTDVEGRHANLADFFTAVRLRQPVQRPAVPANGADEIASIIHEECVTGWR